MDASTSARQSREAKPALGRLRTSPFADGWRFAPSDEVRNLWLHRGSVALLIVWCVWWGANLARHEMIGVKSSWFLGCFGVDFEWHVDRPTRIWLAGGDAYEDQVRACLDPPAVMRMFAWVGLLTPAQALNTWICIAALSD